MMRWVTNFSVAPKWQDRHSLARASGWSAGYRPLAMLSPCVAPGAVWLLSQRCAGPWQPSQEMPSRTEWGAAGAGAGGVEGLCA